jgi:hypothetical protein
MKILLALDASPDSNDAAHLITPASRGGHWSPEAFVSDVG